VSQRLEVLGGDLAALEAIEKRIAEQSAELTRDFHFRLSDVEKALLEFERRGNAFFDERLRLGRFRELFDRERLRRDFETEAVAGLPYEVERRVDGIVDWMVEAELRQWQDVMALLAERPAARPGSEGRVDDRFAYDRSRLLESVREEAREAVLHYDAPSEARRLAEKVRESVAQAALLQVSALGLGTIVAALASTTVAVTGIAAGVSLIGLFRCPLGAEAAAFAAGVLRCARSPRPRSRPASSRAHRAARVRSRLSLAAFVRREKSASTRRDRPAGHGPGRPDPIDAPRLRPRRAPPAPLAGARASWEIPPAGSLSGRREVMDKDVYGRRLRGGMIGGAAGAFIGPVHRMAATMDGQAEFVAGCFSRDAAKSKEAGEALHLDPARVYPGYREMAEQEAKRPAGERLDFVSIVARPRSLRGRRCFVEHGSTSSATSP
jgi:hypothetical protein